MSISTLLYGSPFARAMQERGGLSTWRSSRLLRISCTVRNTNFYSHCHFTSSDSHTASLWNDSSDAKLMQRAARIRHRELLLRWLRQLVIPAFCCYGLFILRPTEGHFIRYLAERRHLEQSFNQLFPPLPAPARGPNTSFSVLGEGTVRSGAGNVGVQEWMKKKYHLQNREDEERVARTRSLFGRERVYSPEDGAEVAKSLSAKERSLELELSRDHPPMHLLGEQLNRLMDESKAYRRACAMTGGNELTSGSAFHAIASAPPIELDFHDWRLCATATIVLRDTEGHTVARLRFFGVCGMLWKQLG